VSCLRIKLLAVISVAGSLLTATAPGAQAEVPRDAAAFRDSVGVNTHLSYYDTVYGSWSRVLDKLGALGVKHVRDGAYGNPAWGDWQRRFNSGVQATAARGIKFTMIMGKPGYDGGTIDNLVAAAAGPQAGAIEAFEGPNEYDISGASNWAGALRSYQQELYSKAKANSATRDIPVIGPSLVYAGSRTTLGNLESALDQGNMHPYRGGQTPSASAIAGEIALARKVSGDKPLIATEAGFNNAMAATNPTQPPVPESVAAVYTLRTFLEHFRAGVKRTFAYQLIDHRPDAGKRSSEFNWGLIRNDWSEKPAFTALKRLMDTVGTPAPLATPHDLPLAVWGDTAGVNRLLLERADGTYLLALWQDASLYDTKARQARSVPSKSVVVDVGGTTTATVHRPASGDTPAKVDLKPGGTAVNLPEDPLILEFNPPIQESGQTTPPGPVVASSFEGESMTLSTGGAVRPDTTASGAQVLGIYSNGGASKQLTTTGDAVRLTVRARGTSCYGDPSMRVKVDGSQVGSFYVKAGALAEHSANLNLPAGAHTVTVELTNDHRDSTCDRNLFVDQVVLHST
jgi:hypothetical protein